VAARKAASAVARGSVKRRRLRSSAIDP
jgi:hypothetical protein